MANPLPLISVGHSNGPHWSITELKPLAGIEPGESEIIVMAESTSAAGRVLRFPIERRRSPLICEVERLLRERWAAVLREPIPEQLLAALSRLERLERRAEATRERREGIRTMDGSGKLHGAVVEEAGRFRAECWLVDSKGNPLAEGRASKLFPTLEEARVWLEQQSHARGYDRIWLEH